MRGNPGSNYMDTIVGDFGLDFRAYNFTKADFIEANIGYRLKWNK